MNDVAVPALARPPQQARGKVRFERILEAAETQLLQRGVSDFSIPELAATLGCTRTSIYHFFPTPYAILNELSRRHLVRLEKRVADISAQVGAKRWQGVLEEVADAVAGYYNDQPVAGMLILGSTASNVSHRALHLTVLHIGRHVEQLMLFAGIVLPEGDTEVRAVAVELGTACLRLSYFLHGEITPAYRRECANAMITYLERVIARQ